MTDRATELRYAVRFRVVFKFSVSYASFSPR